MNIEVMYQPVSSMAKVSLGPGEKMLAEPGAMIGMSTNVTMETGISKESNSGGGLLGKLAGAASRMLTGESFFQNTFTSNGNGELLLAHTLPGDMRVIEVPSHGLKLQSTAFIASSMGVDLAAELGGFKTFFAGEGLFVIDVTARQAGEQILVGAFGGIEEMQVDGQLIIDNGHLVAWESTLSFTLVKAASGWVSSFLSGEGRVCQFSGRGRVWIQTRNPLDYGMTIGSMLPPRSN